MILKKGELLLNTTLFVISCICFFYIIPAYTAEIAIKNDLGPAMFPKLSMMIIMVGSFILLVCNIIWLKKNSVPLDSDFRVITWVRACVAVLMYILGVIYIGFYVSTFVFSAIYYRKLERHAYLAALATNLVVFSLIWFGFEKMMKVALPSGLLV